MAYHIYTTDGIILRRTGFGEANILLHVLTEELGLIIASARSARLSVSKLRPALQEYAHVSISVIHGKGGWKITNVLEKNNFFFDLPEYSREVLAQIGSVLLQMIPGESPHPEVFQTVCTGFEFLKSITSKEISEFECLMVLRILYQLGYVVKDSETETFVQDFAVWNESIMQGVLEKKKHLIQIVNKALKESQL